MRCRCGRQMFFQPSLFGGDGYYLCAKCGRPDGKPVKQPKRLVTKEVKTIDYKSLQDRLFHYSAKKSELDKRIEQQGFNQDLVKERAWCEFVRKQKMKDLGLLGFTQEDYVQNQAYK